MEVKGKIENVVGQYWFDQKKGALNIAVAWTRTITNQDDSSMIPCLEQLVLEKDLRDPVGLRDIKQVAHRSICSREVTN